MVEVGCVVSDFVLLMLMSCVNSFSVFWNFVLLLWLFFMLNVRMFGVWFDR